MSRPARTLFSSLAAALSLLSAGCSEGSSPARATEPSWSCPVPSGGVALAVSGRTGSPAPELPPAAVGVVADHVTGGDPAVPGPALTLIGVDGAPAVLAGPASFSSDAGNPSAVEEDRDRFLVDVVTGAGGVRAQVAEVDVLAALELAARAAGPDGTVVLVDSGLQTVPPLDFRESGLLDAEPAEVVAHLERTGALPDLADRTVLLSGIGDVVAPQAPLGAGHRRALVALWTAVAEAAGATCVAADPTPRPAKAVTGAPPVGPVPVPAPTQPSFGEPLRLPNDEAVGFIADTAEFRDPAAAAETLRPVADLLVAAPDVTAMLTGTTARAGTEQGQRTLAHERAEAVKRVLVELGADPARIRTQGLGSHFPGYEPDIGPDGTQLPGPAASNRSVIITWPAS